MVNGFTCSVSMIDQVKIQQLPGAEVRAFAFLTHPLKQIFGRCQSEKERHFSPTYPGTFCHMIYTLLAMRAKASLFQLEIQVSEHMWFVLHNTALRKVVSGGTSS